MSVELRPYQHRAIEEIREAIRSGKRRILLVLPTGAGKTLTSGSMIVSSLSKKKRSLFVAHRLELIEQSVGAFSRLGVTTMGVIRASDKRRDSSQPVQVASIQTLARRAQLDYDLVFVDEAHRAIANTYTKHVFERHANAVIIGLTATPCGANGKPLGTHFDHLIIGARYSELIAGGHIVAPLVYSTPVLPDLSTVRTSDGEYNQADLEAAVNRGALIGDIGAQWMKHPRQRTVVFAVSVAHSKAIAEMFVGLGVRAEHLDGTTPEDERKAILGRLATGETEVVCNCGVVIEGWDLPACKTVVLACPTKSLSKFMQTAGRCLRPWNNVTPLVLDHGGNVDRHGLPHEDREWSLTTKQKKSSNAPPVKACPACFAFVAAASVNCPHCGHVFAVIVKDPEPVEPIIVDLALRTLDGDDAKLQVFRGLHKVARTRGYKAGYVAHAYRERFGVDPDPSWFSALRSDYRTDQEWKERVKQKQAAKRAAEENAA